MLSVLLTLFAQGQISDGGDPKSDEYPEVDESLVFDYLFDKPNIEALLAEDEDRDSHGYLPRDAVAVPIDLNLGNSGTWFETADGHRVWRLRVKIAEALSLEAYFDHFFLPEGSQFFIYNEDATEVYGAYTERNNKTSGRMSTEMIQGDVINFELFEPNQVQGQSVISIMDIAYRYRDIIGVTFPESGGAQACQVDVACEEASEWTNEMNSVVRVRTRINGQFFWCSGTVMNNTDEDCRPLMLTALHCSLDGPDMSTEADFDLYRFYFRYQAPNCGSGSGFQGNTITGCTRLADSNDGGGSSGSDFLLLEMSSDIPESYQPYYAGWNAQNNASAGGGVGIHHPSGDVKKISTYSITPISATWGTPNTHWLVTWVATANGHGVTEGGSSGSPLFNSSKQVIGTLTGGASFCNEVQPGGQNQPDFYGKMSHHWSNNPNPTSEKLREFLDPAGTNSLTLNGSSNPCQVVSSLDDLELSGFTLMPNPANGWIYVDLRESGQDATVQLFDILGSSVLMQKINPNTQGPIDISRLAPGLYMIQVVSGDTHLGTQQLVVE